MGGSFFTIGFFCANLFCLPASGRKSAFSFAETLIRIVKEKLR
nr:hypothetical protein [Leptospira tipperaryensis]